MGLPRTSAGWLVYIPSTSRVLVSQDVIFDEDFLSTLAHTDTRIPGGLPLQPPSAATIGSQHEIHTTEDPTTVSTNMNNYQQQHKNDPNDVFIGSLTDPPQYSMEEYITDNLIPAPDPKGGESNINTSTSNLGPAAQHKLCRSKRIEALHQLHTASQLLQQYPHNLNYFSQCLQTDVLNPEAGMDPKDFLPAPEYWKQILKLPEKIKQA